MLVASVLTLAVRLRIAVAIGLLLSAALYVLRAVGVDKREFQRNLLWEKIYRSGDISVHSLNFRHWYYAADHSSEYLFVIEADDGRWFHVVSEDVYYFIRDGVPEHWNIRVCPATLQVLDVQGEPPERLIDPVRIAVPNGTKFGEFGVYCSLTDLPLPLREAVTSANQSPQVIRSQTREKPER